MLTERGASLPCGCDARTLLNEMLATLVDDVHSATRLPKHLIMGGVINEYYRAA